MDSCKFFDDAFGPSYAAECGEVEQGVSFVGQWQFTGANDDAVERGTDFFFLGHPAGR